MRDTTSPPPIEPPRHIVTAAGVIRDAGGRILLVHTNWRGWEPPGGQVEVGEDPITALQREIDEESGARVAVDGLIGIYSNLGPPAIVQLLFACAFQGGGLHTSAETSQVAWFTPAEALALPLRPATAARLRDALLPAPGLIYRVYRTHPHYAVLAEQSLDVRGLP